MTNTDAFNKLYEIVVRLRAPDGCPWDREQSPLTLRGDLIEETYECVEAIDEGEPAHIKEELGDIFLLATMIAYMHEQEGAFSVADALEGISSKLIRRHPHVFGTRAGGEDSSAEGESAGDKATVVGSAAATADNSGGEASSSAQAGAPAEEASSGQRDAPGETLTSAQVLQNWAKIKVEQEGRKPKDSILDEVSRGLPPLDRAWKLQKKAAKAGFDWPDSAGVIEKIREELEEVEAAAKIAAIAASANPLTRGGAETPAAAGTSTARRVPGAAETTAKPSEAPDTALEEELGDLLFSVANLCRFYKLEPSIALQRTNIKFCERFKYVEKRMKETGREMDPQNLAVMDEYWNEAKKL